MQATPLSIYHVEPNYLPAPQSARNTLRIAVSVDVLFRATAADTLTPSFRENLSARYKKPLQPGSGLPLIKQMVRILNTPDFKAAEISILAHEPRLHKRICESLYAHGVAREDASLQEQGIHLLHGAKAHQALLEQDAGHDLFLSTNPNQTRKALSHGIPAGFVDPDVRTKEQNRDFLIFAFDWDRCAAIHTSTPQHPCFGLDTEEYTHQNGIPAAIEREDRLMHVLGHYGPWGRFYLKTCALRDELNTRGEEKLLVATVTARTSASLDRAMNTATAWGASPDIIRTTGSGPKNGMLEILQPDLFGDDNLGHIKDSQRTCHNTLAVHIPWVPEHMERIVAAYHAKPA